MAKHHRVYVIELEPKVWLDSPKFRKANPDRDSRRPCVYVGSTGIGVEKRFDNHLLGYKSNSFVKKYGVKLRPDLWEGLGAMTYREAARMEKVLAKQLRADGFGVWQH